MMNELVAIELPKLELALITTFPLRLACWEAVVTKFTFRMPEPEPI
jgi:hypothetical protein